jgi:hypothetical protein
VDPAMSEREHCEKCAIHTRGGECDCDGSHTFTELYEHRFALYKKIAEVCALSSEAKHRVWKSQTHSDGSSYDGWFLLGIGSLPGQQITYHLPMSHWDDIDYAEDLYVAPEFDGHTSDDVLDRLKEL